MKILAIDTTSMCGSVAVAEDSKLIMQLQQSVNKGHAETLLLTIDELLKLSSLKIDDIEGIAVACGPGSFMGIRVGLATAKGIAMGLNIPIVGISSLQARALNATGFIGTVVSMIDAKRKEVYVCTYEKNKMNELKQIGEQEVIDAKTFADRLSNVDGDICIVGDGAIVYQKEIEEVLGEKAFILKSQFEAQAFNLAVLGVDRLKSEGDGVESITPQYVRKSDAEIGFMGKTLAKEKPL